VERMRAAGAAPEEIHGAVLQAASRRSTIFCPSELVAAEIPVAHCVQRPGEFVVTGAHVYFVTVSHGANVSESVRFAPAWWLEFGADAMLRSALLRTHPV
jgi:hypothetical protein